LAFRGNSANSLGSRCIKQREHASVTDIELVSEHDKWMFQSLRVACVAHAMDDEKLKELLDMPEAEMLLDHWLTTAERFESNSEMLTILLERSVALRRRQTE
jgi:hypothetical protein